MSDASMSTKLQWKLIELGIEWHFGFKGATWVGDWCFIEYDNGKFAATCEPSLTLEQVIDIIKEVKRWPITSTHSNISATQCQKRSDS